jgi:hypothetical protein
VRHAGGDDDDVTFLQLVDLASIDARAEQLIRPRLLAADHRAAGDERRLAIDDIEDVSFLDVHFGLTRRGAAQNRCAVVRGGGETSAVGEGGRHFLRRDIGDLRLLLCCGDGSRNNHEQRCDQ